MMEILWLNDDTAHVEKRKSDTGNAIHAENLTWHRMEGDDDSHRARTRSALIVLTDTEGQYWVSMVFQDETRRIKANREIRDVDSLDEALIESTVWTLEKVALYGSGS